ncbi:MAG: DUF1684 domain-containing protein [Cyclobacteriaceae bacterium]
MNKNLKVFGASLAVVAAFFYFISNQIEEDNAEYLSAIEKKRAEIDEFMRTSDQSPFQDSLTMNDSGLNYYPPNPKYRVQAVINRLEVRDQMIIPTSDGKKQRYEKFAYAEFKLEGERYKLLLLRRVGFGQDEVIFTAFADATSGESTYGGGRYLDLSFKNARQITIDFNLAYNPYCAYNASFSCPLPPPENVLTIPILAGEKNYGEG